MNDDDEWSIALRVAEVFAVDPSGCGGIRLQAGPGPVRDAWLDFLKSCLPESTPWRRVPAQTEVAQLVGGLDLVATLASHRPVFRPGILAACNDGLLVAVMAERLDEEAVSVLSGCLDRQEVRVERDGFSTSSPARFGLVALDEACADDEPLSPPLADRLGLHLDLSLLPPGLLRVVPPAPGDASARVAAAREFLPEVVCNDDGVAGLTATSLAFGLSSMRPVLHAVLVARILAALAGRQEVEEGDLADAVRLVLLPRARQLPAPEQSEQPEETNAEPPPPGDQQDESQADDASAEEMAERMIDSVIAELPPDLLAQLHNRVQARRQAVKTGRKGNWNKGRGRGRPVGTKPGRPGRGERVSVTATLRAAAPWQRLRARGDSSRRRDGLEVRAEDFRLHKVRQRSASETIFVVDASGSQAMQRFGEAKGAVELMLAECYVRRDSVALVAFRGQAAEVLLPPTRSLVRAKRALVGLPGGGGTPLAAGLQTALALASESERRAVTPVIVVLTDGRANVALDGTHGREAATADAIAVARAIAVRGWQTLVIDTSPRRRDHAASLASSMHGEFLALPHGDARTISQAVQTVTAPLRAA